MRLTFFLISLLSFSAPIFSNLLIPLSKDIPESIEYRVSVANASIQLVKYHLQEIQTHSDDYQFVQDSVGKCMKYLLNAEGCLGPTNDS